MKLLILALMLSACGKKTDYVTVSEQVECVVSGDILMCSDGTEYELPAVVIEDGPVESEPVDTDFEDDNDVACERDNRHGRKCRRLKRGKHE